MNKQKWPNSLVIIRHGQSERNVKKELAKTKGLKTDYSEGVRDSDTPLTALGIAQAEATGRLFKYEDYTPFDAVLVSPYLRTRQTYERLLFGLHDHTPKLVIEERIREIDFGILDGLTSDGIAAKYPEEVARRKREGKYYYRAPGGENRPDVRMRLRSVLDTLTRDYRKRSVLIVCHSVVVLGFRSLLERWDEASYLQVDKEQDVLNCGITRYEFREGKLQLEAYNDIAYNLEEN